MQAGSCVCSRNGGAARVSFRSAAKRASRGARLVVQAKVDLQGAPRVIRGKCFVTKDVSAGAGWSRPCPPHPSWGAGVGTAVQKVLRGQPVAGGTRRDSGRDSAAQRRLCVS